MKGKFFKGLLSAFFLMGNMLQAFSQDNFFNVPTSEIIEKKHLFFQEQLVTAAGLIHTETIFTFGLGKNLEAGFAFNSFSFDTRPNARRFIIDKDNPGASPDLIICIQKGFKLNKWVFAGIGTRTGITVPVNNYGVHPADFTFVNSRFNLPLRSAFVVVGGYFTNDHFAGSGNNLGYMAGFQIDLIREKLKGFCEFISGNNSLSNFGGGLDFLVTKKWSVALGIQILYPGDGNIPAAGIQLVRK